MANVLKTYKKKERTPLEEDAFLAIGMMAHCQPLVRTENGRIITSSEDGVVLQRQTTTQIIANDKIVVSGGRRF